MHVPYYVLSQKQIFKESEANNVNLLAEWEGRTGKCLARDQGVRPDREPNIFPFGPTLLSQ